MDDDGFTARFRVSFNFRAGADVHFATTGTVGFFDTTTTVDDRGGREVRPGICSISPSMLMSSLSIYAGQPLITSVRLCGGIFVAIPTAIPEEPFTSRFGILVGMTSGIFPYRHSYPRNPPSLFRDRPSVRGRFSPDGSPYNALPPRSRRQ